MSDQAEPTYQGRRLPKPGEAVYDQGLRFDLGTLIGRRQLLRAFGIGAATLGLAACTTESGGSTTATSTTSAAATTGEIPDEIVGPYPADGSNGPDLLEQSGVIRSDIRASFGDSTTVAEGVPLDFELVVTDIANNKPFAGAAVYVWQCDRAGLYSLYSEGVTKENYLRGVQIADAEGKLRFKSIFPACYTGRWTHIHLEVYPDQASITDSTKAISVSQIAFPKAVCDTVYKEKGYEASVTNFAAVTLEGDIVFADLDEPTQMADVKGDVASGYTFSLAFGVDTSTKLSDASQGGMSFPSGGAMPSFPAGQMPSFPAGAMPSGFPGGAMPSGFPAPAAS
ncbi:intradiol ring-cleavage dioxygenase [Actinoplanes subglobosus]|uniref:Intradiol ring-cleavage dioxygenase n=1 Tax=Actinoplanes subglobosus TaxID=1547892 RepID=A0ABV8IH22_9ACTN